MGWYDSRPVTLDPGLTALALRALRDRQARYPFVARHLRGRRGKQSPTPSGKRASGSPYLLVVSRNHPELLKALKRVFGAAPALFDVIPDRRAADRRRAPGAQGGSERRRGERRRRPSAAWKVFGLLLAPPARASKAGKPRPGT